MLQGAGESKSTVSALRQVFTPRGLFAPNPCSDQFRCIFNWWELRRVPYNAIMLVIGIASTYIYWSLFDKYAPASEDDGIFPGLMPIFVGIVANVLYTSGWLVEAWLLKARGRGTQKLGPLLFAIGIVFSILVVSIPAVSSIVLTIQMHDAHHNQWSQK